ncbi:MAG: hypothetical protein LBV18_00335 [Alistipes sp.]|jgi:hypothetical protein|nr:hypothetical protein [Alistipes sp.]
MEDKNLTTEQSLALIARMIGDTRARLERNSGRPFLVWGYTVVAIALLNFWLRISQADPWWNMTWFLIPVVGWGLMRVFPPRKSAEPRTEIDRIIGRIWIVLSLAIAPAMVIGIFAHFDVFGIIALLMASGVAVTGAIVRSRIYTVAGFAGVALSPMFAVYDHVVGKYMDFSADNAWALFVPMLLYALFFLLVMVIPGHVIDRQNRRRCSGN